MSVYRALHLMRGGFCRSVREKKGGKKVKKCCKMLLNAPVFGCICWDFHSARKKVQLQAGEDHYEIWMHRLNYTLELKAIRSLELLEDVIRCTVQLDTFYPLPSTVKSSHKEWPLVPVARMSQFRAGEHFRDCGISQMLLRIIEHEFTSRRGSPV